MTNVEKLEKSYRLWRHPPDRALLDPPEHLLRALLLQILYSIRSERPLIEQLNYDLLYRWFVGIGIDPPVWDPSTFSRNRERLEQADVAADFFGA